ncbi:MAG: hypothetical protein ACOCQ4_03305, partial [bacterium]
MALFAFKRMTGNLTSPDYSVSPASFSLPCFCPTFLFVAGEFVVSGIGINPIYIQCDFLITL